MFNIKKIFYTLLLFSALGDGGSLSSNSTSCSISRSHFSRPPQHSTFLHLDLYKIFMIAKC